MALVFRENPFSQCGAEFSSLIEASSAVVASSQPFMAQHRITNVTLLLSRVLVCSIFALFTFVLFVSISVLTIL